MELEPKAIHMQECRDTHLLGRTFWRSTFIQDGNSKVVDQVLIFQSQLVQCFELSMLRRGD